MSEMRQHGWPPIISDAKRPVWIVWRDIAITAFAWTVFFFLVAREIDLAWQARPLLSGGSVNHIDTGLEEFLLQVQPTLQIILVLVTILGVATLASRRRRNAALRQPQPTPVPDRELASDLGLGERELNDMRRQKIIAIDVDAQGKVALRPDWKSSASNANK